MADQDGKRWASVMQAVGATDPAARTMELLAEQDASEHELGGRGEGEVPPTVQYRAQIRPAGAAAVSCGLGWELRRQLR